MSARASDLTYCFPTISGVRFDLADLNPDDVRVSDIAHALARICRYGGHVEHHYSVAQHSVLVARRIREQDGARDLVLAGLLHDAAEAYVGDVIRPLKQLIGDAYRTIEDRVAAAIFTAFDLDPALCEHPIVRAADLYLYGWERRDVAAARIHVWDLPDVVLPLERIDPWRADAATVMFNLLFDLCQDVIQ